ncbi:hypothetical protein Aduo_012648 [Ancylostoma duodenale]
MRTRWNNFGKSPISDVPLGFTLTPSYLRFLPNTAAPPIRGLMIHMLEDVHRTLASKLGEFLFFSAYECEKHCRLAQKPPQDNYSTRLYQTMPKNSRILSVDSEVEQMFQCVLAIPSSNPRVDPRADLFHSQSPHGRETQQPGYKHYKYGYACPTQWSQYPQCSSSQVCTPMDTSLSNL